MKFKDLEEGAKFRFPESKVCTKLKGIKYQDWNGMNCYELNSETEVIPDYIMFGDLEIGAKFYFNDVKNIFVKIAKERCQNVAVGYTFSCFDYEKCIEITEIKNFDDLPIGAGFRFPNDDRRFIKLSNCIYRHSNGNKMIVTYKTKCISLVTRFGDLKVGDCFCFLQSDVRRIKISEEKARNVTDNYIFYCTPSNSVDFKRMMFVDLPIGARFVADKRECIKLSKDKYMCEGKVCTIEFTRLPVELLGGLRFKDLEIGAIFRIGKDYCLKISKDRSRINGIGNDVVCGLDQEIELVDSKIKRFVDLKIGTWFCYPGEQERCMKVSENIGRGNVQHYCAFSRLVECPEIKILDS